mmetsp:Transcript_90776/g.272650  ORF Transcript_90776/g.272650 Transcript_90776/m.272650 type:complete len:303 (-) Transcript_90776:229-1137(-)
MQGTHLRRDTKARAAGGSADAAGLAQRLLHHARPACRIRVERGPLREWLCGDGCHLHAGAETHVHSQRRRLQGGARRGRAAHQIAHGRPSALTRRRAEAHRRGRRPRRRVRRRAARHARRAARLEGSVDDARPDHLALHRRQRRKGGRCDRHTVRAAYRLWQDAAGGGQQARRRREPRHLESLLAQGAARAAGQGEDGRRCRRQGDNRGEKPLGGAVARRKHLHCGAHVTNIAAATRGGWRGVRGAPAQPRVPSGSLRAPRTVGGGPAECVGGRSMLEQHMGSGVRDERGKPRRSSGVFQSE